LAIASRAAGAFEGREGRTGGHGGMSRIEETKSTTGMQDLETRSTKAISREPISMDETERIAFIQQFGRTYRAFMQAFESQVGQPMPRWRILLALHQHAGELSQKRLVERLRVDPGALTRQLKTLEALGWIRRRSDPPVNPLPTSTPT